MTFPDPFTPADCDLQDFKFMPLDVARLRDSDLASDETPEACWAALLLWCASWHQVPAASVPNNEAWLAKQAGYVARGKIAKEWDAVRAGALRGFVECSDGRLYHPVVAEKALDAWRSKLEQRWRTECARIKKHNQRHQINLPQPEFEAWLSSGCPSGHALPVPGDDHHVSPGTTHPGPQSVPRETPSKRQGEGQGQGQGQGQGDINTNTSEASPLHPESAAPSSGDLPGIEVTPIPEPLPPCPHERIIALYAHHLPQLTQPRVWDGQRAEHMRARWRQCSKPTAFGKGYATVEDGIAFWDRFFRYAASCPAIANGITTQGRTWVADLPWLMKAENFAKVIEGKYAQ